MGERTVIQEALFYGFSLECHVPQDHLLRSIDRFVDLGGIREHLRPYYSETGRPSIDPELMIRMLIIGYCMGIRSERRLGVGMNSATALYRIRWIHGTVQKVLRFGTSTFQISISTRRTESAGKLGRA